MARLYANENFPLPVVQELRRLGHDAITVAETGKAGQKTSDEEVLEFAISERRAVLTHNRKHFFRLHRNSPAHEGIIACTYDPDFVALAGRIDAALKATAGLKWPIDSSESPSGLRRIPRSKPVPSREIRGSRGNKPRMTRIGTDWLGAAVGA